MQNKRTAGLRDTVYRLFFSDDEKSLTRRLSDLFIVVLVTVNGAFILLDTFPLPPPYQRVSSAVEGVSVFCFTVEYLLRLWTAVCVCPGRGPLRARLRYMVTPMAAVDLLSIAPFYLTLALPVDLTMMKILRVLRLLRLLKINRYTSGLYILRSIFRRKARQLVSSFFVVFLMMLIAAVMMYYVENEAQPDVFANALDALWWAVETLTTVGYGDMYPVTLVGKLLSGVIALLGIGLVAIPTGIISAGFMERLEEKEEEKRRAKESGKHYCPYCGKKLD